MESILELPRTNFDTPWKEAIINLYSFIDWVLALTEPYELEYQREIEAFERDRNMKYITSAERIGIKKGIQIGERNLLLQLIQSKFGSIPSDYQRRIEEADAEKFQELAAILISANSLKEIFND